MKTEAEWDHDIINITTRIHRKFPELIKYIQEIPTQVPRSDSLEINAKNLEEYYNSLKEIINTYSEAHSKKFAKDNLHEDVEAMMNSGYPLYPSSEDIYAQGKKLSALNPEDISKQKTPNEKEGTMNEKSFEDDMSGDDLDVPGSELDDQQESVGSEDEENNLYSLGGDDHHDLEENKE